MHLDFGPAVGACVVEHAQFHASLIGAVAAGEQFGHHRPIIGMEVRGQRLAQGVFIRHPGEFEPRVVEKGDFAVGIAAENDQ